MARHHKLRRSQGGTDDPENLMALCYLCHRWIHDHIPESQAQGFLLKRTYGGTVVEDKGGE